MPETLSGLSVITPAAWWALLTLGIPLLIHLFSRSRGRLVKIGHIDLVRKARRLQVTELKLTQWLLLLLRLLILTLAVLLLAGLATAGLQSSDKPTIYLTPAWLSNATAEETDHLLNTAEQTPGSRILVLQSGFPAADRKQLRSYQSQGLQEVTDISNTWALLAERLSLEDHRGEVTVYTTDRVFQFGSRQPDLPRAVVWRFSQARQTPVIDQEPMRVLIAFHPDRAADASLFSAVLATLKEHRLPGLIWESISLDQLGKEPVEADWLIHLGDREISPAILKKNMTATVVLSDTGAQTGENVSQFIDLPFYPFSTFRLDHYSRLSATAESSSRIAEENILLATSDGSPLLLESYFGPTRLLQFNSRFNPRWSSITQQAEFPELLLQLMTGTGQETLRYPDARLDPLNLQTDLGQHVTDIPLPRRSLQGLLATLLLLLWITERWLSERGPREEH